jgi:predicted MFS family arabinose efflux permease
MVMMPLGPQFTQLFNISDAKFGLLVSAYTFAAGASGLLASLYVDRFGRKKLLLTLYVLFALATLACGLAPTYDGLMLARIAAGTFGGVMAAMTQTIVAEVIPFERRGLAFPSVCFWPPASVGTRRFLQLRPPADCLHWAPGSPCHRWQSI